MSYYAERLDSDRFTAAHARDPHRPLYLDRVTWYGRSGVAFMLGCLVGKR